MRKHQLKMKQDLARLTCGLALPVLVLLSSPPTIALAQNTTFTYQGRVTDDGTNFTGLGWFKFALVAPTNINQTASAIINANDVFNIGPDNISVESITLESGGSGYVAAPTVTIDASPDAGGNATATAIISGGVVTDLNLISGGYGYSTYPNVTITPPPPDYVNVSVWNNDGATGSEPVTAVPVSVTNGVFTVILGDQSLSNMSAIPATIFTQYAYPNLQLQVWFNDGVNGFAPLSPLQNVTAAPSASFATTASNLLGTLSAEQLSGVVSQSALPGFQAGNNYDTVGGGENNAVNASYTTVAGGYGNSASGESFGYSTVGGGEENLAVGDYATVGGGSGNVASGAFAIVPGGYENTAEGDGSFVAGENATDVFGGNTENNSFVWGDGTRQSVAQAPDSFNVLATGGVWIFSGPYPDGVHLKANGTSWGTISDRNQKKNILPLDYRAVVDKLAGVPIQQWNYKWEKDSDVPNLGPMAQDFIHAFYPGRDDKSITTLEFDGVELAAIQGLNQKIETGSQQSVVRMQKLETETADLIHQNDSLAQRMNELETLVKQLAAQK